MEIYERMKQLRKEILKLTQDEFSKGINITRSNVASIESGRINITDRVIADICAAFSVREEWLRTGEGEIKSSRSKSIVDELAAVYRLDERRKNLLKNFLSLKDEEQELIVDALEAMAAISPSTQPQQKNASDISDADSEHIREVVDALSIPREEVIRLINDAYDRKEKKGRWLICGMPAEIFRDIVNE